MRDWVVVVVLFVVLSIMTATGTLYARNAESQAKDIAKKLDVINITSQNRCIIQVVLSYPPPVSQEQFEVVLTQYDECIKKETASR